jgi:type II secretory pathway pseudopilin PulG
MRRSLLVVAIAGSVGAGVISAATGATPRTRTVSFTGTALGSQISATLSAFKYHDSVFGNGAGVQTTTLKGNTGTDKTVVYYGDAIARSTDTLKIGAADAKGVVPITGKGSDKGGSGRFKGVTSTYTYSGTLDLNTGVFKVTLKGKYKIPR